LELKLSRMEDLHSLNATLVSLQSTGQRSTVNGQRQSTFSAISYLHLLHHVFNLPHHLEGSSFLLLHLPDPSYHLQRPPNHL
jgi:hypothetical protein